MAFTFNGIGTKFYGKRDVGPDGSYVMTEWFVLIYLPIFPLRSLRVLPEGGGTNVVLFRSKRFRAAPAPLNKAQVRNGYLVTLGVLGVVGFIAFLAAMAP